MREGSRSTSVLAGKPGSHKSPREDEASVVGEMSAPGPAAVSLPQLLFLFYILLLCSACSVGDEGESCTLEISKRYAEWVMLMDGISRNIQNDGSEDMDCIYHSKLSNKLGEYICGYCYEKYTMICAGEPLTELPNASIYPVDMRWLEVRDSNLLRIQAGAFAEIEVEGIKIDGNLNLGGNIEDDAFEGVSSLVSLNITRSGLKDIKTSWFRDLGTLKKLSLQENELQFICKGEVPGEDDTDGESDVYISMEEFSQEKEKTSDEKGGFHDESFLMLPNLRWLDLGKNKINCLSNDTFSWLVHSKLEYLSLQATSLKTIENGTLLPVSKTLRALDISDSLLSESRLLISLLASFSGKESSLEKLGFSSLGLNRMPTKALELVSHSLINLSLNGNYFNTIGKRCFPQMKQLKTLDLRQCDIKSLAEASFSNLPKLTTLLLSYNRISSIDGVFLGLKFLTRLDFSHNLGIKLLRNGPHNYRPFSNDSNLRPQTFQYTGFPTSLISLDLSFTEINKIQLITFKGLFNLKYLSICYTKITGLVDNLHPFKDLNNLTVLEMSGNTWLESNFVSWIFDGLISIQELYLDSVSTGTYGGCNSKSLLSSKSLRPFQLLSSLSLLSLKNNYICNLTQSIFSSLVNLETLYLSNNRLLSWEIPIFSENKNLNTLTLHENQLNYISDTMLSEFKIVSKISLFNNPFLCNCKVWELAMLANSGVIHVVDWNKTDYHLCIDRSGKNYRNFDGEWGLGCQNTTEHKDDESRLGNLDFSTASWSTSMTYILVIFACIFIVLSFFIYRKWNYIRYLGRLMKNMAVIGLMSNEEKTPEFVYNYDVFVSYCDHDRAWVLNELLPNLELKDDSKQPGPAFKVCLHERDFQVGYSILENIISCMDNSRMILLVVSATFLRSQWCQFEMHLAQHRLLETRRDDLLLVLLEEIPRTKRPKTLHYLMKTKTYLVWDTENSQDLFWKRLRRAIKPNSAQLDKSISSFP